LLGVVTVGAPVSNLVDVPLEHEQTSHRHNRLRRMMFDRMVEELKRMEMPLEASLKTVPASH
jgi:hypothetical protein